MKEVDWNIVDPREEILHLTRKELYKRGFGNWANDLVLIPYSKIDELPRGITIFCIDGESCILTDDHDLPTLPDGSDNPNYIDKDTRGGMLAWGFRPK